MAGPKRNFQLVDDDIVCQGGEFPPLLDIDKASATCTKVKTVDFKPGGKRLVLELTIFEPEKYSGMKLSCYARISDKWKKGRPSTSSKLLKMAVISTGQRRHKRITKNMFLNKAFKIRIRPTATEPSYSVAELVELIAG